MLCSSGRGRRWIGGGRRGGFVEIFLILKLYIICNIGVVEVVFDLFLWSGYYVVFLLWLDNLC